MRVIIPPTTAAAYSDIFRVNKGEIISVVTDSLSGTETSQIQIETSTGAFINVPETSAVMTASLPTTTVAAVGHYRVFKSATVAPSGVAIGD